MLFFIVCKKMPSVMSKAFRRGSRYQIGWIFGKKSKHAFFKVCLVLIFLNRIFVLEHLQWLWFYWWYWLLPWQLGKDPATKSDEFLEKFQTDFYPSSPPSLIFGKLCCNFVKVDMVAFMQGGKGQIVSVNISTTLRKAP